MKANKLTTLTRDYGKFLPKDWLFNKKEFVRLCDNWIQIISLNASSYSEEYVPRCSFEFLLMPGPSLGSFLVQELKETKHPVQKWISLKQHQTKLVEIFKEMVRQFRPSIVNPLRSSEILELLRENLDYWPHPYALCVLASKELNIDRAKYYFDIFCKAISDKPYGWAKQRQGELEFYLEMINDPQKLQKHLISCRNQKLSDFSVFQ